MRWLHIGSCRNFECRLRDELFTHLTRLPASWFNQARTGDIMSRLTADVEAVRMGVGPGIMHLFQTGTMMLGAIAIMLTRNWSLTLLALVPMGIIMIGIRRLMPRMHEASRRVQEQLSTVSELAQESFSGSRVVKAFAREDYEIERFEGEAKTYIGDSMRLAMLRGKMHVGIEVMAGLVSVCVLYFGGRAAIGGAMCVGEFFAFFGYFMMLVWPMIAIGWTLALFQRAQVALNRLEAVLETEPNIVSGPVKDLLPTGAWTLRDLTFRHEGATEDSLRRIDLEIPAGSSLAVVGPTGAGKSTLAQVFGRLVDPPENTVFLDGVDVRQLDLDVLRRSIAMVPQDTFLFSDTLHANIAWGVDSADREEVAAAAEAAQVREAIESFPHGFDEIIGERGVTLSGGQKQRVAIARALLLDAPTLILDDCLSAVDTDSEEKIRAHLSAAMEDRTSVIIAHRLSSVRACDHIIVIEKGAITEQGTHDELIRLGGWYAETWHKQQVEADLEAA